MLYLTAIASIPHKTLFSSYFYGPERQAAAMGQVETAV